MSIGYWHYLGQCDTFFCGITILECFSDGDSLGSWDLLCKHKHLPCMQLPNALNFLPRNKCNVGKIILDVMKYGIAVKIMGQNYYRKFKCSMLQSILKVNIEKNSITRTNFWL